MSTQGEKRCKILRNFLRSISGGSIQTGLHFQNRRTYSTAIGGILTIIMYIGVLVYSGVVLHEVFERDVMELQTETSFHHQLSDLPILKYPMNDDQLNVTLIFSRGKCLMNGTLDAEQVNVTQSESYDGGYDGNVSPFVDITNCVRVDPTPSERQHSKIRLMQNYTGFQLTSTFDGKHPLFQYVGIHFQETNFFYIDYNSYSFDTDRVYTTTERLIFNNLDLDNQTQSEYDVYLQLALVKTTDDIFRLGKVHYEEKWYYIYHSIDLIKYKDDEQSYLSSAFGFMLKVGKYQIYTYTPKSLWTGLSQVGGALGISGLITVFANFINEKYFKKELAKIQNKGSNDKTKTRFQRTKEFFFGSQQINQAFKEIERSVSYENWIEMQNTIQRLDSEVQRLSKQRQDNSTEIIGIIPDNIDNSERNNISPTIYHNQSQAHIQVQNVSPQVKDNDKPVEYDRKNIQKLNIFKKMRYYI